MENDIVSEKNYTCIKKCHKIDVFILQVFPTLLDKLNNLDAFTLHPKIDNSSMKTNGK